MKKLGMILVFGISTLLSFSSAALADSLWCTSKLDQVLVFEDGKVYLWGPSFETSSNSSVAICDLDDTSTAEACKAWLRIAQASFLAGNHVKVKLYNQSAGQTCDNLASDESGNVRYVSHYNN